MTLWCEWCVFARGDRHPGLPSAAVKVSDIFGSHLNLTFMRFKSFVLISIKPSLVVFRRLRNNICIAVVAFNSVTFLSDEQMSTATLTEHPRSRTYSVPSTSTMSSSGQFGGKSNADRQLFSTFDSTKEKAPKRQQKTSAWTWCGDFPTIVNVRASFKAHGAQSEAKQKMDAVSKTHD